MNERLTLAPASLCQTENGPLMAAPSAPQRQKVRPLPFRLTGRLLRPYKRSRGRGLPPSDGRNHSGSTTRFFREEEQLIINFIFVLSPLPPPLLATKRIISTAGPNCTSAAPVSGHFSSPPIQPLRHAHLIAVFLYFDETFLPFSHQKEQHEKKDGPKSSRVSSYKNARDDIRRLAFHSTSAADDADDSQPGRRMMNIFLSSLIAGCSPSTTSHDRNTQNLRSHCLRSVRWRPVIPEITCWPAFFLHTAAISGRKN
jgi:hypothetical protein